MWKIGEGSLPRKDALTWGRINMCVAALPCALTRLAPVTPWDRGIACALATALKKVFSRYGDQS